MPVLEAIQLSLQVDQVLKSQGIDPALIRARRPRLVALTETAIEIGAPLLAPRAVFARFPVRERVHECLKLAEAGFLQGALIADQLSAATEVLVVVCTVGDPISRCVAELFDRDPALAVALDGLASAAVEALGNQLCRQFDRLAEADGLQSSLPLNPGMVGWPVEIGQPQIFGLLAPSTIGVELDPGGLMKPLKSLSFVMGFGRDINRAGKSCDFCALQTTCRYRAVQDDPPRPERHLPA